MDGLTTVLGVLGAYFAILFVVSVSVETLLEPFTWFKGLRKQASPDDIVQSVQEWLPEGSGEAAKVLAIQTFASQTKTDLVALEKSVTEIRESAVKTLEELGLSAQVSTVQKDVALKLQTLRQKHMGNEKSRITWLRVISAVIGTGIAAAMQINTFQILSSLFPEHVIQSLNTPVGHVGGVLLTGLAASAGSSFWHDMLGRVRSLKNTVQNAENAVSSVNSGAVG